MLSLLKKYKKDRSIRLHVACEIDEHKNIVSTEDKTSLFCVFPLVGIEEQIQMPVFIDSPDFEPDSERQSLILSGNDRDEEKDVITEVGINKKILSLIPDKFRTLLSYLSSEHYNGMYNLANGLKTVKDHSKLDKKWYSETLVSNLRAILSDYPIVKSKEQFFRKLSDCVFVKENKEDKENALYELISEVYPERVADNNREWAHALWKDDSDVLKVWGLDEFCEDIQSKERLDGVCLLEQTLNEEGNLPSREQLKLDWYNRFLKFVTEENELLMKDYALLPNMNGVFLKKDTEGFKQAEGITEVVLSVLKSLGEDMKPLLLHQGVTSVSLDSKFNSISFSAKANALAKSIIETTSGESSDEEKLHKLIPLFSITVDKDDRFDTDFIIKRKRIFEIIKSLFELVDTNTTIDNSFTKSAWEATDNWLIEYFIRTIEQKSKLSALPSGLGAKWLNDSILSLGITLKRLNQVAILPNQHGVFCKSQDLFIDGGIPDVLKDSVFESVGMSYRALLLDKEIDISSLGKTKTKTISDFAKELNVEIDGSSSYSAEKKHTISSFGLYRRYSEETLKNLAHFLIQILPEKDNDGIIQRQTNLKLASRFFLGESCQGHEVIIDFNEPQLWSRCNKFICREIMSNLEDWRTIEETQNKLNSNDEELFENLNLLYGYLATTQISTDKRKIVPNLEGVFTAPQSLFIESETIDKELKDVIALITDDTNNYYKILIDPRCRFTLSQTKTSSDAYSLIDGKIKLLYDSSNNWENESFKEACRILIDVWGDHHKNVFDENHFPKVYPIRDSISMNVVWTKKERQQIQQLKNTLSLEDLSFLAEHSDEIKSLSLRTQELEDENERLRIIIKALKEGRSVDVDLDDESDLSKAKQYEAQIEAQKKLMEMFPCWQFPDHYGEQNESGVPYCKSTVNAINEIGEILPIVLKSYKSRGEVFNINPKEWEWVVKQGAKLLVYTYIENTLDIVEILREDLIMKQSNIRLTFSSENLDSEQYKDRISNFASILQYFSELHFKFDHFHIKNNAPRARDIYAHHLGVQTEQEF